jgi:eukaryotic-like serine/threonine-protein kinase
MRFSLAIMLAAAVCACQESAPAPAPTADADAGAKPAAKGVPAEAAAKPAAEVPALVPIDPSSFVIEVKTRDRRNMVKVQGSKFLRGSVDGVGDDTEHPQTRLRLETYWIDRTPVTVSQFLRCVNANRCKETTFKVGREKKRHLTRPEDCNFGVEGREDQPMNCVSWFGARAYCRWAEKKLASEAQWEKAARGSDGRLYPWGNEPPSCERACVEAAGGQACPRQESSFTCKPGEREAGASPYGALDMAGNVWEWTDDGWSPTFYKDDPENHTNSSRTENHPVRGGSVATNADGLRAAKRIPMPSGATPAFVGFRCTLD